MSKRAPIWRWAPLLALALVIAGGAIWVRASLHELQTGQHIWPWSAYATCGTSAPTALPDHVQIGLYEEFPNPWRLAKLKQLSFPVTLAIAAKSRDEFLQLRQGILAEYPQVREVYFWPLLAEEEGYYPGPWSDPAAIERVTADAAELPTLLDLEIPHGTTDVAALPISAWWQNQGTLRSFISQHQQPVHIWRTHLSMGLNPAFMRLAAMHFDPGDYQQVTLHLDLYTTGQGKDPEELRRIIRCGVERYGARFVPSMGVLNDGEGDPSIFVPADTLRRDLRIARDAGVSQIWLFGANGLNEEYLQAIQETLPLETQSIAPAPQGINP